MAGLPLLGVVIFLGVRAVATPRLHIPSASMVAAAGLLALLVTSFPQETWDGTPVLAEAWGLVPCGAGAQAPICRAGVFLLTLLKLCDLEHALGWARVGADEGPLGSGSCGQVLQPLGP